MRVNVATFDVRANNPGIAFSEVRSNTCERFKNVISTAVSSDGIWIRVDSLAFPSTQRS